ncbi:MULTISPECIES: hypothetical protein [Pseudomonas syringae group]|uniref:hypothetical protein n=1 Tax=Pseudomonas syringae group TaxID=136849 RepID=UPI000EFE92FF|nr:MULTISPECIES: hypothetical protein [Pseudomonas syringae group]MBI6848619.1 hypothetical protein [Pseudomonas syringae]TES52369.1 hypothetical protein E2N91_29990 [Pseudomonas syringae pv. tomato]
MDYETVLLIGGPNDGKRISVLAGVPFLKVGSIQMPAVISAAAAPPDQAVPYQEVIYHRHPMQTSHGLQTAVYVYGGIDALAALINGYRSGAT